MLNKALILLGIIFLTLVSCTDFDRKEQLKQIANMKQTVDSLQKNLETNRIDTLAGLRTAVMNLELRIRNNYTADTIDIELSKKMTQYQTVKKFFVAEKEANHFKMLEVTKGISELGFTEVEMKEGLNIESLIVISGAYDILAKIKNSEEEGGHAH